MFNMKYRELNADGIEKCIPLYIAYYNGREGGEWTEETVRKRIRQVVTREDSFCLLAEQDGETVAFAMGYMEQYDDGAAYDLVEIVVADSKQGKGIGTAFMTELERRVRELGAFMIQLQAVNDDRHDRFYGRLGFRNCSNLIIKSKIL